MCDRESRNVLLSFYSVFLCFCVHTAEFNYLMCIYTIQSQISFLFVLYCFLAPRLIVLHPSPSVLLSHLLPSSLSYTFPQFGLTSVKIALLSSSLTCISVKLSTETLSLTRIKHTSLLTNSKRCATLLMSAAPRSPALPVVLSSLFHLSFLLSPSTPLLLSPFSYVV